MSYQLEQKSFLPVNCPREVARDMTEENVTRQLSAPIHRHLHFIIASFTICLLAALGTILVLVLQRTGSAAQCPGQSAKEQGTETMKGDSGEASKFRGEPMTSQKAAAQLQVLKSINQPQLNWIDQGILHNIQYSEGNLVIQIPGMYFIYCHLYFYIAKCQGNVTDIKLNLLVNQSIITEKVLTLCSSQKMCDGINQDSFIGLLVKLKKGDRIAVQINPFNYLDADTFPQNNVFGAFRYNGEDWGVLLHINTDQIISLT